MSMTAIPVMKGFIRLCEDGWSLGWHERNGGNLTYRLRPQELAQLRPELDEQPREWVPMGVADARLGGECFIATGSGKFFRNVAPMPQDSLCIVEINAVGDSYRILWGLVNGGRPTSEFPTHYLNHCVRAAATGGACRVMYHAHTPAVVALTYVLPLTDRDFSRVLWQSETECPVVFPWGVGVVGWMVPGGAEIAVATCEKMKEYDAAIWAHHGSFASGPDFDTTFGLMHTIEKAADIHLKALSCAQGIRQTIRDDELRAIAAAFGVTLNEAFLA
ncbi:MAG: rhamnulose-1-phosphate aldolase [Clostridia bacterium]